MTTPPPGQPGGAYDPDALQKQSLAAYLDQIRALSAENTRLQAEVDRLTAGADPTPPREGEARTPGQALHWLLNLRADERVCVVEGFLADHEATARCFIENHDGLLQENAGLRRELDGVRKLGKWLVWEARWYAFPDLFEDGVLPHARVQEQYARLAQEAAKQGALRPLDDWMGDEHRKAALEGFLGNPVAVEYARRHAASQAEQEQRDVEQDTAEGMVWSCGAPDCNGFGMCACTTPSTPDGGSCENPDCKVCGHG